MQYWEMTTWDGSGMSQEDFMVKDEVRSYSKGVERLQQADIWLVMPYHTQHRGIAYTRTRVRTFISLVGRAHVLELCSIQCSA